MSGVLVYQAVFSELRTYSANNLDQSHLALIRVCLCRARQLAAGAEAGRCVHFAHKTKRPNYSYSYSYSYSSTAAFHVCMLSHGLGSQHGLCSRRIKIIFGVLLVYNHMKQAAIDCVYI